MEVVLTPEQPAFFRHAIASGRVRAADDAVREALDLWSERERERARVLAAIDAAEETLLKGGGRSLEPDELQRLATEFKRSGRERANAGDPPAK